MKEFKFDTCQRGSNIKKFVIGISVVTLVCYGLFNARNLIMGPSIEIFSPSTNTETDSNIAVVKGRVKNVTYISINERPIYVDTNGIFQEKLLLSPGFNIISLKAKDRFNEEDQEVLKIYYKQNETTELE